MEIRSASRNLASARVAERTGYVLEGELLNNEVGTDGELIDTLIFALTPENTKL